MDLEGRILALSDRGLNGQSGLISAVLPAGRYVVEVRSLVFSFPSGVIIDMSQARGLSLAEVMIVMAIIALSVGLVGPRNGAGMTRIEVYQAEQTIRSFVEMARSRGSALQSCPFRSAESQGAEGMEVLKDVRVNLTVGAVLASPPAGEPAEG